MRGYVSQLPRAGQEVRVLVPCSSHKDPESWWRVGLEEGHHVWPLLVLGRPTLKSLSGFMVGILAGFLPVAFCAAGLREGRLCDGCATATRAPRTVGLCSW